MTSFTTREVPWMKIGRLVDQPKTAKEAATLAKLDFTVSLRDLSYRDEYFTYHAIPSRKALIADDNGDFMGVVSSSSYHTLQYGEAFNFMDAINPLYVAAGHLRKRRQGFMVVKPEFELNVLDGQDPHELYAVLRTSHDCSRAIEVLVMPLRGRCMNQLTLQTFAKDAEYRWSIKHTSTMKAKLEEAQKSLVKIGLYAKRFEQNVERLANVTVKPEKARQLLKIVIPRPKTGKTDRTDTLYDERLTTILDHLWMSSPTVGYAGTGWGLVNAVSEYFDWYRVGGTAESRFIGALEGQTHKKINRMAGLLLSNA